MIVADIWTVMKTYVFDGRTVCDLARLGIGAQGLTAVPCATLGGGPSRGLFVPPAAAVQPSGSTPGSVYDPAVNRGAQVLVLYARADPYTAPRPWIIGCVGYASGVLSSEPSQTSEADDDADTRIDARAVAMLNADALVLLDQRGELTLQPASGGHARVQLQGDGALRVSRDGDASENAALTGPLVDALADRDSAITALQQQVAALTLKVTALDPTSPPPPYLPVAPTTVVYNDVASDALRLSPDKPV